MVGVFSIHKEELEHTETAPCLTGVTTVDAPKAAAYPLSSKSHLVQESEYLLPGMFGSPSTSANFDSVSL